MEKSEEDKRFVEATSFLLSHVVPFLPQVDDHTERNQAGAHLDGTFRPCPYKNECGASVQRYSRPR